MVRYTIIGLAFVLATIAGMGSAAGKPPTGNQQQKQKLSITDKAQLDQMSAMSNILSNNTASLSSKLAIAMAGQGSDFVLGHGSGGMGFRGTGTGGGGTDGVGRIHGLGKTGLTPTATRHRKTATLRFGEGTVEFKPTKGVTRRAVKTEKGGSRGKPCTCPCQKE